VEDSWPRILGNFRDEFSCAPALEDVDLDTFGRRLQAVAAAAGAQSHPFAAGGTVAPHDEAWKTVIHGDLKAANLFAGRDGDVAFVDFQFVGYGLAATDLAHFVTASVAADDLLADDGTLLDGAIVDAYRTALLDALVDVGAAASRAEAAERVPAGELRRRFDTAVLDKARFVVSYLWPRIDASPETLRRGAGIPGRNSYNKDVRVAVWLVARTDAALRGLAADGR